MEYEKYRWFFTSSGKLVRGGKNAEQNEKIMAGAAKSDYILHTAAPGSPFCIIENANKKDIEEAAVFTAAFSQEWKRGKKKAEVHVFKGENVVKKKGMKTGTFGITGKPENKIVELKLGIDFQKGKLRAIPVSACKKSLATIIPGELSKEQAAEKLAGIIKEKIFHPIKKEEILGALPSDKIGVIESDKKKK